MDNKKEDLLKLIDELIESWDYAMSGLGMKYHDQYYDTRGQIEKFVDNYQQAVDILFSLEWSGKSYLMDAPTCSLCGVWQGKEHNSECWYAKNKRE